MSIKNNKGINKTQGSKVNLLNDLKIIKEEIKLENSYEKFLD